MDCLLPKNSAKKHEVLRLAKEGLALAELEYLGLSLRIITIIEESCGAIYLEQLLKMKDDQILEMSSLGEVGLKQLRNTFERIFELRSNMERWNRGSDNIEKYKKKVDIRKCLS